RGAASETRVPELQPEVDRLAVRPPTDVLPVFDLGLLADLVLLRPDLDILKPVESVFPVHGLAGRRGRTSVLLRPHPVDRDERFMDLGCRRVGFVFGGEFPGVVLYPQPVWGGQVVHHHTEVPVRLALKVRPQGPDDRCWVHTLTGRTR